jgi:hypothetical protein
MFILSLIATSCFLMEPPKKAHEDFELSQFVNEDISSPSSIIEIHETQSRLRSRSPSSRSPSPRVNVYPKQRRVFTDRNPAAVAIFLYCVMAFGNMMYTFTLNFQLPNLDPFIPLLFTCTRRITIFIDRD